MRGAKPYPSMEYVGSSTMELGVFLIGFGLLIMFVVMAVWLVAIGETARLVTWFLGLGLLLTTPMLTAALFMRGRRMKRVEERARLLASLSRVASG